MKTVVCTRLAPPREALSIEDRERIDPPEGHVSIAVKAAGVSFVDGLAVQGLYQVRPEPPFTPGMEVAGVIDAVGPGVSELGIGDEVMALPGFNGFREQVVIPARAALRVPKGLDLERAASVVQIYCTALYAIEDRGQMREGETLLVLGAGGGVGLAAIDVARANGIKVIAAASSESKLEACRAAGAAETLLYEAGTLKEAVRKLAPEGVDGVFDPVGGAYADPALRTLRPGGRYLVIGFASGEIPAVPFNLVLLKSCQVVGVDWGGFGRRDRAGNDALLSRMADGIASGRLRPPRPTRYPLEEAATALSDLLERRLAGKAVLIP